MVHRMNFDGRMNKVKNRKRKEKEGIINVWYVIERKRYTSLILCLVTKEERNAMLQ